MTTDLERLSAALKRDTPDKRLEEQVEKHRKEIEQALNSGKEYVLDGPPSLVIKKSH